MISKERVEELIERCIFEQSKCDETQMEYYDIQSILQSELERQNGCEYCVGEKTFYKNGNDCIEIFCGEHLYINIGYSKWIKPISYCPICGKKLGGE